MNRKTILRIAVQIQAIMGLFLLFSCGNDDNQNVTCNTENLEADISVTKNNSDCKDLNLIWEVSFGVELSIEVSAICNTTCNDNALRYSLRVLKKNSDGVTTLSDGTITNVSCNDFDGFTSTLNTETGAPQNFEIGDTIQYEIYDFGICRAVESSQTNLCNNAVVEPLDLPVISDFYILEDADFDCN